MPALLAGGAMGQERVPVFVDAVTCRLLERHVPAPDVAYRPGIDVDGKPVVPADLVPPVPVPRRFAFEVMVDPFDGAGHGRFGGTEMPVGDVAVDMLTGEITYEGRILRPADRDALVLACRERAR